MTLRTRLIAAQVPLFAALAGLGILFYVALARLGAESQVILKDNFRSVLAAQRMNEAVERIDDVVSSHLLGLSVEETIHRVSPFRETFEIELKVEQGNITETGEREVAQRLTSDWEEAKRLLDRVPEKRSVEEAKAFYASELAPMLRRVRADTAEILGINQDAMVRKSDHALVLSKDLQVLVFWGCALSTAIALLIVWQMTRRFLHPIQILQSAVKRVGEGDLEVRSGLSGRDEVTALAQEFDAMAERLLQYRKSSLGDLLRAQQAAQASIDSLPEPVLVFGTDGLLLSLNLAAENLVGGASDLKQADPNLLVAVRKLQDHIFGGKGTYTPKGLDETIRVAAPGGDRYLLPYASPLKDEDGTTIGVTLVLQDVTRFKRFDELKDDMVSTVAHEFRTPLTSIRMAIHICLEEIAGPINEKQAEMLTAAREDCERLQSLVDDLLDLSRLQSGITPTRPEPVAASTLIDQAVSRHREEATARSVTIEAEFQGEDLMVLADPARIGTVFDNLIQNALRYSPEGQKVWVKARGQPGGVRFEVVDSGPGIAKEHQDRIFDKLYQVPGVEGGASGLGLSIAREIVLAHGGEIGVESVPGLGSTFWFTLNSVGRGKADGTDAPPVTTP